MVVSKICRDINCSEYVIIFLLLNHAGSRGSTFPSFYDCYYNIAVLSTGDWLYSNNITRCIDVVVSKSTGNARKRLFVQLLFYCSRAEVILGRRCFSTNNSNLKKQVFYNIIFIQFFF